jgi:uncharacterized protein (TIGR00255 family)
MTRSMTGFGSGRAAVGKEEIQVELRSVNHKFCEVKTRLPRELAALEQPLVKQLKERLARGAVDFTAKRTGASDAGVEPKVDVALAKAYAQAFAKLEEATGLKGGVGVAQLASLPGILKLEEPETDLEAAKAALEQATEKALEGLLTMRALEGKAIAADLTARIDRIGGLATEVRARSPQIQAEYQKGFEERVAALAKGVTVDPARLAQEVALWAERTDVAEELTRLDSHLVQFKALLAQAEPSGRKLDFLLQEMHREVNTTGSKSQHPELSRLVVELKAELERVREQVQNVE